MRIAVSIPRMLFPEDKKHVIPKILISSLHEKIDLSSQLSVTLDPLGLKAEVHVLRALQMNQKLLVICLFADQT